MKNILKLVLLAVFAGISGIFADQVVWPYLVQRPLFYQYHLEQPPVYVTEKQETTITENTALKDAIEKVAKTVVNVKSVSSSKAAVSGSGLALTSDGLVVTFSDLLVSGAQFEIASDGQKNAFEIVKRDKTVNLALVKVDKGNMATASFYDLGKLKLGERIFLLGYAADGKQFANDGIVRSFTDKTIETNIIDSIEANGSPVFDIEGNILGLAKVDKAGRVSVVPVSTIKSFSGL